MAHFQIGDGRAWSFLHGRWTDGPNGEMIPPDGAKVEYLAVRRDASYGNFSARFRFKFRVGGGGARFLFRLQDSRRFYALDIPWCGQQSRARHFWAGIVMADGTALQRYLSFNLIPGLAAQCHHWYEARLEVQGPRLRAWIDERPVADVEDTTYASGRVGLGAIVSTYEKTPHFGGVVVEGTVESGSDWPGLDAPPQHWITPCPQAEPKTFQGYATLLQSKSGDLTLSLTLGNPNEGEVRRRVYLRSTDAGRTWSPPEPATLQQGLGANFVRKDGTWVCVFSAPPIRQGPFYSYESDDEGRSWIGPQALRTGPWPANWSPGEPWPPVRTHDGTLVLPVIAKFVEPGAQGPCLMPFYACFAMRSEDDGQTWSAPVWCDSNNSQPGEAIEPGSARHSWAALLVEVAVAEVEDNVLLGIGRPTRDPYMWQISSTDGGRSWEPAGIGPFPGYCPSLTRTKCGALLATTRVPYFAAHLSRDGGRTWDLPVIVDYPWWANQRAVEAEPDVVVVTYMGAIIEPGQPDSRIARLRVTDKGLSLDH